MNKRPRAAPPSRSPATPGRSPATSGRSPATSGRRTAQPATTGQPEQTSRPGSLNISYRIFVAGYISFDCLESEFFLNLKFEYFCQRRIQIGKPSALMSEALKGLSHEMDLAFDDNYKMIGAPKNLKNGLVLCLGLELTKHVF